MIVDLLHAPPLARLRFEVDGPPVPKGRPRFSAEHGRAFTPKRTRVYEAHVRAMAAHALAIAGLAGRWPLAKTSRYVLRLDFYMPTRRPVDCDNLAKGVSDAIEPVLLGNDSRVVRVVASRAWDKARPRAVIDVEVVA